MSFKYLSELGNLQPSVANQALLRNEYKRVLRWEGGLDSGQNNVVFPFEKKKISGAFPFLVQKGFDSQGGPPFYIFSDEWLIT